MRERRTLSPICVVDMDSNHRILSYMVCGRRREHVVGVSQAGYSFWERLPIFLLIFLLPVDVAVFVKWKVL